MNDHNINGSISTKGPMPPHDEIANGRTPRSSRRNVLVGVGMLGACITFSLHGFLLVYAWLMIVVFPALPMARPCMRKASMTL